MGRTVEISEEAYQAITQQCEKEGKTRKILVSNLILAENRSDKPINAENSLITEKAYEILSSVSNRTNKEINELIELLAIAVFKDKNDRREAWKILAELTKQ